MLDRHALPLLRRLALGFPVLALTGPRQSGKTTDCGISHTTARSWLTVLEASYVVH